MPARTPHDGLDPRGELRGIASGRSEWTPFALFGGVAMALAVLVAVALALVVVAYVLA